MTLKIMDYANNLEEITIPDNTVRIDIEIITGDEVAHVTTNDGKLHSFPHSTRKRCNMDFFDGRYTIFDKAAGIDVIEKWNLRCDTYDYPDCIEC